MNKQERKSQWVRDLEFRNIMHIEERFLEETVRVPEINGSTKEFPHVLMSILQQNVPLKPFKEISVKVKSVNIYLAFHNNSFFKNN